MKKYKECKHCGEEFKRNMQKIDFCSFDCYLAFNHKRIKDIKF